MAADAHHLAPTIELAVSDLGRSRAFYADLLGFVPAEGWCYSDTRVLLVSPLLAHGYRCLVLSRDRRRAGMGGMMLELESRGELLDLYMLARLLGAPTSPLVTRGRTTNSSPFSSITLRPFCCMAARCGPRAISVTSTPFRCSNAPICAPMAPAP